MRDSKVDVEYVKADFIVTWVFQVNERLGTVCQRPSDVASMAFTRRTLKLEVVCRFIC